MNYKKLYKQLIVNAKHQNRTKSEKYYEKHHIIPDFMFLNRKRKGKPGHMMGNPNSPNNIVLLTPREHFIAHVLFHKIMKGTTYEYPSGAALIFFFTKFESAHPRSEFSLKSKSKWYENCRLAGIKSISAARKGNMPAKDKMTGQMVGSVSINHEKVLSGEWVHHSHGRIYPPDELARKIIANSGMSNANCSGKTDNEIYEFASQYYVERLYFEKREFELLCLKLGFPTMRRKNFRFSEYGGGSVGLLNKLKEEFPELVTLRSDAKKYKELKVKFNAKNNQN